jgi:hypothetical protein
MQLVICLVIRCCSFDERKIEKKAKKTSQTCRCSVKNKPIITCTQNDHIDTMKCDAYAYLHKNK